MNAPDTGPQQFPRPPNFAGAPFPLTPLTPGQALALGALLPIRPCVRR
jgi:hypothetical protein